MAASSTHFFQALLMQLKHECGAGELPEQWAPGHTPSSELGEAHGSRLPILEIECRDMVSSMSRYTYLSMHSEFKSQC